jgi:hypothetical protein
LEELAGAGAFKALEASRRAGLQFFAFAVGYAPAPRKQEFAFGAELVDADVLCVGYVYVAAFLFDGPRSSVHPL